MNKSKNSLSFTFIEEPTTPILEDFKKLVRKAVFLSAEEEHYFDSIPNYIWSKIFDVNFDGNFNYATRVLLSQTKDIERIDFVKLERMKQKIANLSSAAQKVSNAITKKIPIIFITDFDNDGSLSQAIIYEYFKIDEDAQETSLVEYAQTMPNNTNRGFTADLVEHILAKKGLSQSGNFLVITADNGINSRDEQKLLLERFPKSELIVTDHHNPDKESVVEENDRTIIFNPHYKPTEDFEKNNISGANTLSVLLKAVLAQRFPLIELEAKKRGISNMDKLSKVANLLDYVKTYPADKPEKDYVVDKFLELQPLLNINNSLSTIIARGFSSEVLDSMQIKNPSIKREVFEDSVEKVQIQNEKARVLLNVYKAYQGSLKNNPQDLNFNEVFLLEMTKEKDISDETNMNFIEQLRPHIFRLSADDDKSPFLDSLNDRMIDVFKSLKTIERTMQEELRLNEVVSVISGKNSKIMYADAMVTKMFNRKMLNKVYNSDNPGFFLTLDHISPERMSGSFRSLYDISDILFEKDKLEKKLGIKIETPGHERAAGFIVKSLNPMKTPITEKTLKEIQKFIEKSIVDLKVDEKIRYKESILIDLDTAPIIDKINRVVRGHLSHFERINPILKLNENMVWTDVYSTEQFRLKEYTDTHNFGFISIKLDFDDKVLIVPTELVRKVIESGYEDYLSLGYIDAGVFMVDRLVKSEDVEKIIDMRKYDGKTYEIDSAFEKDFKDNLVVKLNEQQLFDSPFFKYNAFGERDFNNYMNLIVNEINANEVDVLSVFDVEANGFGNGKLMNFGAMNYKVIDGSGMSEPREEYIKKVYRSHDGQTVWLDKSQIKLLKQVSFRQREKLSENDKKYLVVKIIDGEPRYFTSSVLEENKKLDRDPKQGYTVVKNFIEKDGRIIFNQLVEAEMLALLVKDEDFLVPQEMTALTGITQDILNKHGHSTSEADKLLADYYRNKKVLFGAHNTPYDARIMRANTPQFYDVLRNAKIYDSALFSKDEKLAYDNVKLARFETVSGLSKSIYFYDNDYSDFNLSSFLKDGKDGYFPDRTNRFLLEIENGDCYLVDKVEHGKVNLNITPNDLLTSKVRMAIPNISVKYSVEKLSEQWMIRSLLDDDLSPIEKVNLEKFKSLKQYASLLNYFEDNYSFAFSPEVNFMNFKFLISGLWEGNGNTEASITYLEEELKKFLDEFVDLNKIRMARYADSWIFKQVLSIKDPKRNEVTNDLVDLVFFQTQIPKDKIRAVFELAINFKEKYKISHVLQHEGHINGLWEGDNKGDIAFEDKLTFGLLYKKFDVPFAGDNLDRALLKFDEYKVRAQNAFVLSDLNSNSLAHDSYSYRQGIQYDRDSSSELINHILEQENGIGLKPEMIIKFKLGGDVIPQDSNVYAIKKQGVSLTREDIEKCADMIAFIAYQEQLNFSLSSNKNLNQETKERVQAIFDANLWRQIEYKSELAKSFRYIEFNRHVAQFKAVQEGLIGLLDNADNIDNEKVSFDFSTNHLSVDDWVKIKQMLDKHTNMLLEIYKDRDLEKESAVSLMYAEISSSLDDKISLKEKTSIETAWDNKKVLFSVSESDRLNNVLFDDAFFAPCKFKKSAYPVPVQRREPLNLLFTAHPHLGILDEWIKDQFDVGVEPEFHKKLAR